MAVQYGQIDVHDEMEKKNAIKAQQNIWHKLCESRLKLQKLLIIANQLPQADSLQKLNIKYGENLRKSEDSLKLLLGDLINLHQESPRNLTEEKSENENYSDILSKRFKSEKKYRNTVIQKWDDKVRLSTGRMTQKSFNAFGNSAVKQIEQVLQDKSRLIRRTQLKRSVYRVLGKPELSVPQNIETSNVQESISKQDMLLKDYDPEIYDDDDFYRQLLKDIIQSKLFGTDPLIVRKQMELQKIRNKMKRKADTKASKGRKLRYDINPKLVNFMAPIQRITMPDKARENLLKCLFGKGNVL